MILQGFLQRGVSLGLPREQHPAQGGWQEQGQHGRHQSGRQRDRHHQEADGGREQCQNQNRRVGQVSYREHPVCV